MKKKKLWAWAENIMYLLLVLLSASVLFGGAPRTSNPLISWIPINVMPLLGWIVMIGGIILVIRKAME